MMNTFERALERVFFVEGGYSDHPEDKGGKTKYGITEGTYRSWVMAKNKTWPEDYPPLKDITKYQASLIYRDLYWDEVRGDELPPGVSLMVFDSAVHAGPSRAIKWLQRAVGEKSDGIIGPKTLRAVNWPNRFSYRVLVVAEIAKDRLMLARKNETFVKGWFNRIIHILMASVEGISRYPVTETCVTSNPDKTPPQ